MINFIQDIYFFLVITIDSNALKCYSRARDYCMSAKQVVNMCVNVIKVCTLYNVSTKLANRLHLTIIPRARIGYEMIDSGRGA